MDHRPKYKSLNYKSLRRKLIVKSSWPSVRQSLFRHDTESISSNNKIGTSDFIKIKNYRAADDTLKKMEKQCTE